MKKILCLLLALLFMPCTGFAEHYHTVVDETAASDGTYLVAVNTNPSPSVTQQTAAIPAANAAVQAAAEDESIPYGTRSVIETEAGTLYELEPEHAPAANAARTTVQTNRLYSNEVCEVYLEEGAASELEFTKARAAQLGDYYRDFICKQMQQAFGALPDQEKKLKILCYDIQDDFVASDKTKWAYIAGMFDPALYQSGHYAIMLDTYPTMSFNSSRPTEIQPADVTKSYGTLAHEFQHLLNQCAYDARADKTKSQMNVWLNECFSECANEIQNPAYSRRITDSNSTSIAKQLSGGLSLLDWQGTLGNYSLSYLFGQYLRTQTKAYPGGGNEIYRKISDIYYTQPGSELDAIAAAMTEVTGSQWTPEDVLFRFRVALVAQQDSGVYGFGGEEKFLQYIPATAAAAVNLPGGGATVFSCPSGYRVPSAADGDIRYCVVTPSDIVVTSADVRGIQSGTNIIVPLTTLKADEMRFYTTFYNRTARAAGPTLYAAISNQNGQLLYTQTAKLSEITRSNTKTEPFVLPPNIKADIQPGDTLRVYALSGGLHPYMQTIFTFVQP